MLFYCLVFSFFLRTISIKFQKKGWIWPWSTAHPTASNEAGAGTRLSRHTWSYRWRRSSSSTNGPTIDQYPRRRSGADERMPIDEYPPCWRQTSGWMRPRKGWSAELDLDCSTSHCLTRRDGYWVRALATELELGKTQRTTARFSRYARGPARNSATTASAQHFSTS